MVIGALTADVHIPDSQSLKSKRRVVRSLKDRMRRKFNVSVAEVDQEDLWQRATIAFAVVSTDARHVDEILASIREDLSREPDLLVLDTTTEIL